MRRFLTWLVLEDGERIIRIKSLWPTIGRNPWGKIEVTWPCLLIERRRGGQRETIWPVWNRVRLAQLWKR